MMTTMRNSEMRDEVTPCAVFSLAKQRRSGIGISNTSPWRLLRDVPNFEQSVCVGMTSPMRSNNRLAGNPRIRSVVTFQVCEISKRKKIPSDT